MTQEERRQFLIQSLLKERKEYREIGMPSDECSQRQLLRGLMNIRPAQESGENFLRVQDEYLREEIMTKGITDIADLESIQPGLYLWQGDIISLRCDAIVLSAV